jgi:hypothetical protein
VEAGPWQICNKKYRKEKCCQQVQKAKTTVADFSFINKVKHEEEKPETAESSYDAPRRTESADPEAAEPVKEEDEASEEAAETESGSEEAE